MPEIAVSKQVTQGSLIAGAEITPDGVYISVVVQEAGGPAQYRYKLSDESAQNIKDALNKGIHITPADQLPKELL